jgi:hypothetical protein
MNCRGMVMRCGEHVAQTTLPHFLQWCFRYRNVKFLLHTGHCETSASGCQGGSTISLTRLGASVFVGGVIGRGGSGRSVAGDDSSTIGSECEVPGLLECILMLDGRLIGESAVVRRRLRSELREDDESVREGRFGRVYRDDEEGWGGCRLGAVVPVREGWFTFWSARKSIHVSPRCAFGGCCARKCDATTPCE